MDFTVELSKLFNLSPFEVLKQDKDEVIMLINYFIEKGDTTNYVAPKEVTNAKTSASDGFWDF